MRRLGQVQGARSGGQIEKLLLIGVGLVVVALVQLAPWAGERGASTAGSARPVVTATPARTAAPTPPPVEASAPAPAAGEEPASTGGPAPTAPSGPPPADQSGFRIVAGGAGANMRGAPSTGAPIVRRLRDGAFVANLNQQQSGDGMTWRRVAEDDAEGWVAAELLAPAN